MSPPVRAPFGGARACKWYPLPVAALRSAITLLNTPSPRSEADNMPFTFSMMKNAGSKSSKTLMYSRYRR